MKNRSDEPTDKIPAIAPTQQVNAHEIYPFQIEPTEHVKSYGIDPYTHYYPYEISQELPPPPPPTKKNSHVFAFLFIATLLVLILVSMSFIGIQVYGHPTNSNVTITAPTHEPTQNVTAPIQPTTQPTSQPTTQPTITPTDTHILTAADVYNDIAPKLNTSTHSIVAGGHDTSWAGWPYSPARQAFVWYDHYLTFEVAAFNTSNAASIDTQYSNSINQSKYWAMQRGSCMFLYDWQGGTLLSNDYILLLANEPGCK